MNQRTQTVAFRESERVELSFTEVGDGRPMLLLHGGAGPMSVGAFGGLAAGKLPARVLTPTHPGFGGTPRPTTLSTIADLARAYAGLLDALDLEEVTVVGSSIGGWIAAELALVQSPRVRRVAIVDGVGIEVEGHPVADPFAIGLDELMTRSYFNPAPFRAAMANLTDAQKAAMAANRETLAVYGGRPSAMDSSLCARLANVRAEVLVVWGEADKIADADYGRAYAAAIPAARFELIERAGHMPQIETPDALLGLLSRFIED